MNDPRVEQIFFETVDLPPDEQERAVAALPAEIRHQVLELIGADRRAANFFASAVTNVASMAFELDRVQAGSTLGVYKLEGLLGRGGMGAVYEGTRSDGQFEQRVAIKVVDAGKGLAERFQRERRILALLSHPNIARLLDGGSTADGLPYFVMELVDRARPIDAFCAGLEPRRIVSLFLPVCHALEYVHRNLVVHGDLKPGNLLVDESGTPKVVDFGIARILARSEAGPEYRAEQTQTLAVTLNYASPEQLQGQPLVTATDVYGLASVLYRCLTGEPALDVRDLPLREAVKIICEREPEPASRLRLGVGVDLSRILAKGLDKTPTKRYSSIETFRADLEAYLDGRAVEARGAGLLYRGGKAARRHWVALSALAMIAAVTAGAFVSVTQAARQAETQRHSAEMARQAAEQQREIAEKALQQAGQMRQLAEAKTVEAGQQSLAAQERLQSERDFTDVFTRLLDDNFLFGNPDSVRLLDGWIKTQIETLARNPADTAVKRMTGFLYFRRCAARVRGSIREGEADCKTAIEMLEPFVRGPVVDDWILRTATAANSLLGGIYAKTGRKEEAIRYRRRSVELADRFAATDPSAPVQRLATRSALADSYLNAGRFDDAIQVQEEAYAMWNRHPHRADLPTALALMLPATMQRYSQMLGKKDPVKAELQMRKALELLGDVASRRGAGCLEANEYANALNSTPFEKQRHPDVALRFAEKAVAVCPADRRALALDTLAWAHFRRGDTAKAMEVQKQAIAALPSGFSLERMALQGSLQQFEKTAPR